METLLYLCNKVTDQYYDALKENTRNHLVKVLDAIITKHPFEKLYMYCEYEGEGITVSDLATSKNADVRIWSDQYVNSFRDFFEDCNEDVDIHECDSETIRITIEQIMFDSYGFEFELFVSLNDTGNWDIKIDTFSTGREDF